MSGSTNYGTGSLNTNTGANNSAFGFYAGYSNTDASCNTAVGADALVYTTSGPHNTAIGAGSMCSNILGQSNTAVGSGSLAGNPANGSGNENVAIGAKALYSNYGNYNIGVGCYALQNNTDGSNNTAVGYSTLQANTIGAYNTALGYRSLQANTGGSENTAVGLEALYSKTNGGLNTAIGIEAGFNDISGNFNTFLGATTDVSSNTLVYSNSTALGYSATIDASNQIVLGGNASGSYPSVKIPGSYVGINGVYNLSGIPHVYNLDVSGNINFTGNLYQKGLIYDASGGSSQWSNGSGTSIYYNTGSVGIGTNSPNSLYALDVSGNMRTTADAFINGLTVGHGIGNISTNTAVGSAALAGSNTGNGYNTAIGQAALASNTAGTGNTAVGVSALQFNAAGSDNTAVGILALLSNTGSGNTGIGLQALYSNIGSNNTGVGAFALNNNLYGNNSALGYRAGYSDISGNLNTFIGYQADVSNNPLGNVPYGVYNNSTALGYNATIDASNQIVLGGLPASGSYPGVKIPGSYVGIGGVYNPGNGFTLDVSGNLNTTMDASINSITVGRGGGNVDTNTAVGFQALQANISGVIPAGYYNTAVGYGALNYNVDGHSNTAIGYQALTNKVSGDGSTAIGLGAGHLDVSGNSNTFLGCNTGVSSSNIYSNSTALGFSATIDASNQIYLGNSSITSLKCQVPLVSVSDARDKTNFEPLDAGLNFINEIHPVRFDWNQRGGGLEGRKDVGFTAQDLLEVQEKTTISIPHLVDVSNPDKYSISNTQLLPILVKAVQELSAKVTSLETELSELKK